MDHALRRSGATEIGTRIRRLRAEKGLTATALASRVGVSEDAICKIEAGRSKQPSFVTGVRIASALGVSPTALAFGESAASLFQETDAERPATDLLAKAVRVLRETRSELETYGVLHASIFGSVARGEALPESDVDILIEVDQEKPFTLITLSRIGLMLEERVGRRVDVVTRGGAPNRHPKILAEAVRAF